MCTLHIQNMYMYMYIVHVYGCTCSKEYVYVYVQCIHNILEIVYMLYILCCYGNTCTYTTCIYLCVCLLKLVLSIHSCLSKSASIVFLCSATDHTPPRRKVADKMSPMRLLGAMNKEDMLNEINRKMQRALEEALTKNIHLQEVHMYVHVCLFTVLCTCIYMYMYNAY